MQFSSFAVVPGANKQISVQECFASAHAVSIKVDVTPLTWDVGPQAYSEIFKIPAEYAPMSTITSVHHDGMGHVLLFELYPDGACAVYTVSGYWNVGQLTSARFNYSK